jgi:folate-binding protein YgfZ
MILRYPSLRHLSRRLHTSAPPAEGVTNLSPTRSLLHIHGRDATKFLQGITTRDIPSLPASSPSYAAFLNPQGRVLFDAFLYPLNASAAWRDSLPATAKEGPEDPAYLLEVDAAQREQLELHLKRYRLRSKFTLRRAEEWTSWAAWGGKATTIPGVAGEVVGGQDPRVPGFGRRFVLPAEQKVEQLPEATPEEYRVRRILWGVAEGQQEIVGGSALPGESNIDICHGVDWRKGCYVGQELTIRTRHTGVVRKRILPVMLYPQDEAPPQELVYNPEWQGGVPPEDVNVYKTGGRRKRPTGKWLGGVGNVGLAKCRLEQMTPVRLGKEEDEEGAGLKKWEVGDEFEISWKEDEEDTKRALKVKAFVPEWMKGLPELGGSPQE